MEKKLDMRTRKSILQAFKSDYQQADRKTKSQILDQYVHQTGHNRKYVIAQLGTKTLLHRSNGNHKKRKPFFSETIIEHLKKLWEIFDGSCGQRLRPQIHNELDRLIGFGEITLTDEERQKLLTISAVTIDRRLKDHKKQNQKKFHCITPKGKHLKSQIPQRLTWSTPDVGHVEIDLVAHNGGNPYGDYICTLSVTDVATQWWEGQAIKGKSAPIVKQALLAIKSRLPFPLIGVDSDNGPEFINALLLKYCQDNGIEFTRGRPHHKNDNAYVEQKNWTHVRKLMGNHRFDVEAELIILNHLYVKELALYKNFFQVNYKLESKEWIHNKRKRHYEALPQTPYQRVLVSPLISDEQKQKLKALYESLNPADLKRRIDKTLQILFTANQKKTDLRSFVNQIRQIPQRKEVKTG